MTGASPIAPRAGSHPEPYATSANLVRRLWGLRCQLHRRMRRRTDRDAAVDGPRIRATASFAVPSRREVRRETPSGAGRTRGPRCVRPGRCASRSVGRRTSWRRSPGPSFRRASTTARRVTPRHGLCHGEDQRQIVPEVLDRLVTPDATEPLAYARGAMCAAHDVDERPGALDVLHATSLPAPTEDERRRDGGASCDSGGSDVASGIFDARVRASAAADVRGEARPLRAIAGTLELKEGSLRFGDRRAWFDGGHLAALPVTTARS